MSGNITPGWEDLVATKDGAPADEENQPLAGGTTTPRHCERVQSAPRLARPGDAGRDSARDRREWNSREIHGRDRFDARYAERCTEHYQQATANPETAASSHVQKYASAEDYAQAMNRQVQMNFISKVYALLALQLGYTFFWCMLVSHIVPSMGHWCIDHYSWMVWVMIASSIVTICLLFKYRESYPANLILLAALTQIVSYSIGTVSARLVEADQGDAVILAWATGMALFVILTLFARWNPCKIDFASWGMALFVLLTVFVIWGVVMMFVTCPLGYKVLCVFGVLLFAAYIMYDTHMIYTRLGPGDEVVATVTLYLDVVNLVMNLMGAMVD